MRGEEVRNPKVELASDYKGRQFGEQCKMLDCINRSKYAQRGGPNLMSDIVGLHTLFGESKQHVQSRVTRSESELIKLSEMKLLEKRNDFMSTAMMDSMTLLMIGSTVS